MQRLYSTLYKHYYAIIIIIIIIIKINVNHTLFDCEELIEQHIYKQINI